MKVQFSPRARRRMKTVARWWRENRPSAPTLFDDELIALVERLEIKADVGAEYQIVNGEVVRRTLLPKSAQHVYYAVNETNGEIVIHTIWGARRGTSPPL